MIYQLTGTGTILRLADNASIPPDPANTDYQTYLAWLEEGNEPLLPEQAPLTWDDIRAKRDQLIRESDWTMVQDATVNQAAWAQYRQILRDLPQTYASVTPDKVVWPEPPLAAGPNTVTEIE
jgi:hypothetical protein